MRLVYLSPLPWSSFAQRPHRFVEWFHLRHESAVLWVDPYPTRFPVWGDLRRLGARRSVGAPGVAARVPEWLTVFKPVALPIEPMNALAKVNRLLWGKVFKAISDFLSGGRAVIGIGKPSEMAVQVLRMHPEVRSFYDAMDDYPAFYDGAARRAMKCRTNGIASRVSHILTTSEALDQIFQRYRSKLVMVKNACDVNGLPTVDAIRRTRDSSVLGYVGTIGQWFDWSLIFALAETTPSVNIRLVGPVHAEPPAPIPSNLELLPACGHATAMKIMQTFAIGLIPFKSTDLTKSVDPIKYYEYRALGLPVISSRFGEMGLKEGESGVFLVDEHSDFEHLLREASNYQDDEDEVMAFRSTNSWTVRFDTGSMFLN